MVPDVDAACERFSNLGVEFVKKPNDGNLFKNFLQVPSLYLNLSEPKFNVL